MRTCRPHSRGYPFTRGPIDRAKLGRITSFIFAAGVEFEPGLPSKSLSEVLSEYGIAESLNRAERRMLVFELERMAEDGQTFAVRFPAMTPPDESGPPPEDEGAIDELYDETPPSADYESAPEPEDVSTLVDLLADLLTPDCGDPRGEPHAAQPDYLAPDFGADYGVSSPDVDPLEDLELRD